MTKIVEKLKHVFYVRIRPPPPFLFFFPWHYSPLWVLACRTISFHFFSTHHYLSSSSHSQHLKISFYFLFPSFPGSSPFASSLPVLEWRSFWASYPPPFSPGNLTSLSFALFIHFTIFSPLLIPSSSRFVLLSHYPFSYLGPYIRLNIFLSKIRRPCSSFFVNVHASAPYDTTGLISVLYNIILVAI